LPQSILTCDQYQERYSYVKKSFASIALVLAACGQDEAPPPEVEAPVAAETPVIEEEVVYKHAGLYLEHMDPLVRPGDDFYAYMNGGWIDVTEIPADKPGYGIATILRDESQEHVKSIIELSAAGDFAKGSDEQKVGDLYTSYMNMETRNRLGVGPLRGEFERIDALVDRQDLVSACRSWSRNTRISRIPLCT
jgi:putative endopeptidase